MAARLGIILTLFVLAACQPEPPPPPMGLTAPEAASCLADGGRVGGTILGTTCFRPTPDAGKQCSKQTECSTICLSALETGEATGTCAAETPKIGCFEMLDENGTAIGLCVD